MHPPAPNPSSASPAIPLDAVAQQLHRILNSPTFADSGRLRALLAFLVEQTMLGHGAQLKESVLATEVFGRRTDFDPRIDSIVRVQIRNLRRKLTQYYAEHGAADPLRIVLPRGGYAPEFVAAPVASASTPWWRTRRLVWISALAAVLLLSVGSWWLGFHLSQPIAGSLAVLPFTNIGGNPDSEYLADSFAEELMSTLEASPGLRVASRNSAFRFKGRMVDTRDLAHQLGVGAVLEGSFQPVGDRLRVRARLVDGRTGLSIWSGSFDEKRADTALILGSISHSVARTLGLRQPPPAPRPASAEVQDLYLRGVYLRGRHDGASREQGVRLLERAATLDPGYAPALAAFAASAASECFHAAPDRDNWARKARQSARRALAIEEANPKALYALAWVTWFYDRDWPAAEGLFRLALSQHPTHASIRNIYALALTSRGRFDEAVTEARRAREIDPATFAVSTDLGLIYYLSGRFDECDRFARSVLALDPSFEPARMLLAICRSAQNRHAEAASLLASINAAGDSTELLGRLGYVQALAGNPDAARALAARIPTRESDGGDFAGALALIHTGSGDFDQAFLWLNRAASRHETLAVFAAVDPMFAPLRRDPRFAAFRQRLGL
jgi:TolB-like protein/Flp pilus assembly protein TadD